MTSSGSRSSTSPLDGHPDGADERLDAVFFDGLIDDVHDALDRTHLDLDISQHELGIARRVLQEGEQIAAQPAALDDLHRRAAQPVVEGCLRT